MNAKAQRRKDFLEHAVNQLCASVALYSSFFCNILFFIGFCMLTSVFISCQKPTDYNTDFVSTIIVEGKIELNGYAKVILTRNIPYYINLDSTQLLLLMLRQAKVTVTDGAKSEILTLRYRKSEFPPYFYEGNELTGEAGKTYNLTIDYGDKKLTATTTIPKPVFLDSVWFQPKADDDSLGTINALLKASSTERHFYRIFTQIRTKQKTFYPTLVPNYDDLLFSKTDYTIHLSKGTESYLDLINADFDYKLGDTVLIKFCTIDEPHFRFWQGYEREVSNVANPFASSYHEIPSNIVGDGKGVWGGYGSTIYQVINR